MEEALRLHGGSPPPHRGSPPPPPPPPDSDAPLPGEAPAALPSSAWKVRRRDAGVSKRSKGGGRVVMSFTKACAAGCICLP